MNSAVKIIILVIIFIVPAFAQDYLKNQMVKVKELYLRGEYFDAITEMKRLLFFDKDKLFTYEANELIGECYKEGAKFTEAIIYFAKAEQSAGSDQQIYDCRISIIRINILRRSNSRAASLLDALEKDPRFKDKKEDISYWRGWNYIFSDDWDKASLQFAKISPEHPLKKLCDSIDNKQFSVTEAKLLSYFIPGAGQFYTGNYASGLLSLGWNVLWGYTTITAFNANRIFDGIMVGDLLWFRFYNGNNQNAEKFAVERNVIISNNALFYLQHGYTGEKP
jgi:tetratricopeptide (TPR) repeat protein